MRKIAILAAMLALVTPAMAVTSVTIDACDIDDGNAAIIYNATGGDVSGFGLNITIDDGNITAISGYHIGESKSGSKGYGIFPGTIDINDTTGMVDSYGNPVAPSSDPCALGGLGTGGITIELGALYTTGNAPNRAGTLCVLTVSDDCNLTLALNARRGGVVDVNYADASVTLKGPRHIDGPVSLCLVPDISNMTAAEANAAIEANGLAVGTINWSTSWSVDVNKVMDQDPNAGEWVSCNPSTVSYLLSSGCYTKFPNRAGLTYGGWVAAGKPASWCGPAGNPNSLPNSQCIGDASNSTEVIGRGTFAVGYADITILLAGFNTAGNPPYPAWIAADFDHASEVIGRGTFRVGYNDIAILLTWFNTAGWPTNCP